ncbi:hypothetical protein YB2330_003883 [Saitoella coloradoensis]
MESEEEHYPRDSIVITSPFSPHEIFPEATNFPSVHQHLPTNTTLAKSPAAYLSTVVPISDSQLNHAIATVKAKLRQLHGPRFWGALVESMNTLLDGQYCFLAKRLDTGCVKTYNGPKLGAEGSCVMAIATHYRLDDTRNGVMDLYAYAGYKCPCAFMCHGRTLLIPHGMSATFPENPNVGLFAPDGTPEAYLAVPMWVDGVNVGHISVLWTKEGLERSVRRDGGVGGWGRKELVLQCFVEVAAQRLTTEAFGNEESLRAALDNAATVPTEGGNLTKEALSKAQQEREATEARNLERPITPTSDGDDSYLPIIAPLASNMSHEIRTPLQGVIGLLDVLFASLPKSSCPEPSTETVGTVGEGLEKLVEDTEAAKGVIQDENVEKLIATIQTSANHLVKLMDNMNEFMQMETQPRMAIENARCSGRTRAVTPDTIQVDGVACQKVVPSPKKRKTESSNNVMAGEGEMCSKKRKVVNDALVVDARRMSLTTPTDAIRSPVASPRKADRVRVEIVVRDVLREVLESAEVVTRWGRNVMPSAEQRSIKLSGDGKALVVQWEVQRDLEMMVDRGRLKQNLSYLVHNAFKFTTAGSITVSASTSADNVIFLVKDTGVGIPAPARERLFQPFSQADKTLTRAVDGAGFGLVLAKRLGEVLGGECECVKSVEGSGSVFRLSVPANAPKQVAPVPQGPVPRMPDLARAAVPEKMGVDAKQKVKAMIVPQAAGQKSFNPKLAETYPMCILIAEDNAINRRMAASMLYKLGYAKDKVLLAENGKEAAEKYEHVIQNGQEISLVLMDCWMPVMDGFESTRRILDVDAKSGMQGTKIVAITADAMKENLQRTSECGMSGYVLKPFRIRDIEDVIVGLF